MEVQPVMGGILGIGGAEEDRTPDLRIANATLSQLSYRPMQKILLLAIRPGKRRATTRGHNTRQNEKTKKPEHNESRDQHTGDSRFVSRMSGIGNQAQPGLR